MMGMSWTDEPEFRELEERREFGDDADNGYEPDDPKNPVYAESMLDWADAERKRAKGE